MPDVDSSSSSTGDESDASEISSVSSDDEVAIRFFLYDNKNEEPRGCSDFDVECALQLLDHNDPNFKFVKIEHGRYIGHERTPVLSPKDFERVGRAIAKNTCVENLKIVGMLYEWSRDFLDLLRHLVKMKWNRSIRRVELEWINEGEDVEKAVCILESILENNPNLKSCVLDCCPLPLDTVRRFMVALKTRGSPLDLLQITGCQIGDEAVKEMATSFKDNPEKTPKILSLDFNDITDVGCIFLSELIGNYECKLEEISLRENSEIGLPGVLSIVSSAAARKDPLKKLDFSIGDIVKTDEHLRDFMEFFSAYPDLLPKDIECWNSYSVSRDFHQALGNILARRSSPLESITFYLSDNEPDVSPILLREFLENPIATAKKISYTAFEQMRSGDLHLDLARLLRSRLCSLENLDIDDVGQISDDAMIHIITSLEGNRTLKRLSTYSETTSARVMACLMGLLCNRTTIMSTYNSNHTLIDLGHRFDAERYPNLCSYLNINCKYSDKGQVATAKIIEVHFAHNFQLDNFDSMTSPVLAQVVSFVNRGFQVWNEAFDVESEGGKGKDVTNNNLTVNFLMMRKIPTFFDYVKPRWKRQNIC